MNGESSSYSGLDPHYFGFFQCFNATLYYEAHEVLEELWLAQGKQSPQYAFYKGLIQCAGAFVHMKLNHESPAHRVHAQRLEPAARLLRLTLENLENYPTIHENLELEKVRAL